MNITAGVTIESGELVTRQTLYNLWANATLGQVDADDLAPNILPIIVGTGETISQAPGTVLYDQYDMLWKFYADEVNNTGVSLWLSFGPDRFDEAFLAAEPIPAGAACRIDPTMEGRWVRLVSGWDDGRVVCLNQNPQTAASGTWFVGGIEGIMYGWFPYKPAGNTETGAAGATIDKTVVPISWAPGGLGENPGGNYTIGAYIYGVPTINVAPDTNVSNGSVRKLFIFSGPRFMRT